MNKILSRQTFISTFFNSFSFFKKYTASAFPNFFKFAPNQIRLGMNLDKLNKFVGWGVFAIATIVYLLTVEDTTSLWDCGEYITTAYKLEVGHPPGAPLFMMLGRLFSMFAGPENAAYMINVMSALSSSFTILFLFWTITLLGKRVALSKGGELTEGNTLAIIGSAIVGSLAYTFTDSFWFSAVEGEVYAMASLFTAIVFWAILKWDDEVRLKKQMLQDTGKSSLRWIILIMFILGLAIGVHLLGLLAVPAVAFVVYFNHYKKVTFGGILLTGVIGVFTLGFIQEGIIPGTIKIASIFERQFVNALEWPFYSGTIVFFALLILLIVGGLYITKKKGARLWNSIILSFGVLMIGYSCFAMIVIRSNANTPLDENDPENLVTLHSYLKREQYGDFPLLSGQYYNSKPNPREEWADRSPTYMRRWVVRKNGKDIKGYKSKDLAEQYIAKNGGKIVEKYFMSNDGKQQKPTYEQTTFFPRMYFTQAPEFKKDGYRKWSGYADNILDKSNRKKRKDKKLIGTDGKRIPTFSENMQYFASYQVNFMYWRYFLWNFSGRQNDIQGHGDVLKGNWQTGFNFIDSQRLGDQSTAPHYTKNNPSNNKFYLLPLILGLIGLVFHFLRDWKGAFVTTLLFLLTGLAIVVYLNQKPFEPRERDYAYAGSFYAFAVWIGFSVYGLYEAATKLNVKKWLLGLSVWGVLALIYLVAGFTEGEFSTFLTWLTIGVIAAIMLVIMVLLKKSNDKMKAYVALALTIFTPIIMGVQGWDDHDRSERTTARDLAYNYLVGVGKNGILFANGDNDTFPLWYLQEVEGERTDVRVSNLSLLGTDWYTEQMTFRAYESDPLPIMFSEDQYRMNNGYLDYVAFASFFELTQQNWDARRINEAVKVIKDADPQGFNTAYASLTKQIKTQISNPQFPAKNQLAAYASELDSIYRTKSFGQFVELHSSKIIALIQNGTIDTQAGLPLLRMLSLRGFPAVDLKYVSEFMRNENNLTTTPNGEKVMMIPYQEMYVEVNKDTVAKYQYVRESQLAGVVDRIEFSLAGNLMKDDIMMLETIANNDWKRTIQFTSPGGSEVTEAFAKAGHVAMEGMIYKLTPARLPAVRMFGVVDLEEMYENLMDKYKWGGIKNGVLVDYYTRRHTGSYRMQFYAAAKGFLDLKDRLPKEKASLEGQVNNFPEALLINPAQKRNYEAAKARLAAIEADLKVIENADEKALALINKSLEELPIGDVIEYGERGRNFLHHYIEILYAVDAPNKEEVANKIINLLDGEMMHYLGFETSMFLGNKEAVMTAQSYLLEIYDYVTKYDPEGAVAMDLLQKFKAYQIEIASLQNDVRKSMSKDRKANRAMKEEIGFLGSLSNEFNVTEEQK